jgi:hypothetical protein
VYGDGIVSEISTSQWTAARIVGLPCGDKDNDGGGGGDDDDDDDDTMAV